MVAPGAGETSLLVLTDHTNFFPRSRHSICKDEVVEHALWSSSPSTWDEHEESQSLVHDGKDRQMFQPVLVVAASSFGMLVQSPFA